MAPRSMLAPALAAAVLACSSVPPASDPSSEASDPATGAAEASDAASEGPSGTMTLDGEPPGTSGTTSKGATTGADDTTGGPEIEPCAKNVVLMGYWPPTNEMLRQWSKHPLQNPGEWQGENWRGLGYDVYAFFPEFPPDGDPTNDPIGEDGAVGSPDFDLRVDYQATSADFWRIVDDYQPIVLITTSRGGAIGWEIEAIEGGHGMNNPGDPSRDWSSDRHGDEHYPTRESIDPRSWDAISTYRRGMTLSSTLPMETILDAASALDTTSVEIDETGTSGNFLSGFLGLHGLYYNQIEAHNVAAGHIHVGFGLPVPIADELVETTLEVVLREHPATDARCPQRASLRACLGPAPR